MSQENVEIVRAAVAAINDSDLDRYLAQCAPEIELVLPVSAIEGANVGTEGIREFFAGIDESASEFQLQVASADDLRDGRVLAAPQLRFDSTGGVAPTQPIVNVYTLAHGKLKRVEVFRDRIDALKAVGLDA